MIAYALVIVISLGAASKSNWLWTSTGPDGGTILSIASDGSNTVATALNNVWRYNGSSWTLVLNNVRGSRVLNTGASRFCLIKEDFDSARVYFSSDGGQTWRSTYEIFGSIYGFSKVHGSYVYIATFGSIHISSDGGQSWGSVVTAPYADISPNKVVISYLPDNPATVYLGVTGDSLGTTIFRLYRSTDYGSTWTLVTTTDYLIGASSLAINPSNPQELVASVSIGESNQYPGLYVSEDGGATWSYIMSSLTAGLFGVTDIVFKNDTLYAGSVLNPGIVKGNQVAGIWFFTRLDTIHMPQDIHITSDGTIYVAYSGGVLMSTDGSTFTDITSGLRAVCTPEDNDLIGTKISNATGGTLYMIDDLAQSSQSSGPVFSNVIYKTTNYGMSWQKIFVPGLLLSVGIQTPQSDPTTVYVSGIGYELNQSGLLIHFIYRSNDSGMTFVPTDQGVPLDSLTGVYDVFWVSPSDPNNILVKFISFGKGWNIGNGKDVVSVLYSSDGGETFTQVLPNYIPLRSSGSNDTVVLAVIDMMMVPGVKISTDRGHTWYDLPTVLCFPSDVQMLNGDVYLACVDYTAGQFRLLRVTPGQAYWDTVSTQISDIPGIVDASLSGNSGILAFEVLANGDSVFVGVIGPGVEDYDLLDFRSNDLRLLGPDPSGSGYLALLAFTPGLSTYYTEDPFVGIQEDVPAPGVSIFYSTRGPVLEVGIKSPYRLEIFDLSGRRIFDRTLEGRRVELGKTGKEGVYFYRLSSGRFSKTGKFVVVR